MMIMIKIIVTMIMIITMMIMIKIIVAMIMIVIMV